MRWPWSTPEAPVEIRVEPVLERRAIGGFTSEIIAARESWISGRRGIGELTATVTACLSLWEGGLSLADVDGTDLLTPRDLALLARSLGLRGEALFLIDGDRLVPAADWDLTTRDGTPTAYRLSISDAGGGRRVTVLAPEVLHVRLAADVSAPWTGQAPLRRAAITAGLLHAVESALSEVFENAPLGSQIVPMPETAGTDLEELSRGFRGRRGKVLLRESVTVTAAGGPAPQTDWRPSDVSPDLSKSMTAETLAAAREAICAVFGVLPGLFNSATTGPMVREAQRHLASWQLSPIASLIAQEATEKLGQTVTIDVMRPLQAYDAGGRSRALATVIEAMVAAKAGGLAPGDIGQAFALVDWQEQGKLK